MDTPVAMARVRLTEGEEAQSLPEDLAQWLGSSSRTEPGSDRTESGSDARAIEEAGGERLPGLRAARSASGLEPGYERHNWRRQVLASFQIRPFISVWLVALSPSLVTGCGSSKSSPPPAGAGGPRSAAQQASATATPVISAPAEIASTADEGTRLYDRLCAACHGANGDGNGPAARFLYPKPRSFREGRFRMVSTTNMIPSDDDLMRTLERGLPGSSMLSFGHLSIAQRKALVAHVRQLVSKGLEDRLEREAAELGEQPDPLEMAEFIKQRTQPGPRLELPAEWPAEDAASIARGRELYVKACAACHGETGKGDGVQEQKDELGMPIRPRDYTSGIFKGGREREQLYARIALGMPGTPMPGSPALKPAEIADLIHFIRSLSDPKTESLVVHRRTTLRTAKASESLAETIPDRVWEGVAATHIVVSPLWWRDYPEPDLQVQALHDGQTVALRLSWSDASRDGQAIRPQDFPDMAAVQLYRGPTEPFLGMGGKDAPVDVWLWNAAAQADTERYADVDTAYPNMSVDSYPLEAAGDGPRLHTTERQPKDFLTAWAAGNQRSDPTHPLVGSNLAVQGFGSTTLRPPVSQDVKAHGVWKDGRWTVVLRRPLAVKPEAGVALASGAKASIAFALWDGAARDRNGQKLVSIWHDLELP